MKPFFSFLLLFCCFHGFCQDKDMVFVGKVKLNDGEMLTYRLEFNEQNGKISGTSITDTTGPEEMKASITGNIDPVHHSITFVENGLLQTRFNPFNFLLCFFHCQLKITHEKDRIKLIGPLKGYKADGVTPCDNGVMVLYNVKPVKSNLLRKVAGLPPVRDNTKKTTTKKVRKIKPPANRSHAEASPTSAALKDTMPKRAVVVAPIRQIHPGETFTVHCPDTVALLDVWDSKHVDGDVINLFFNDQPLLSDYMITGNKKRLTLKLAKTGDNLLRIVCVSEGTEPTCTATVIIRSGNKSQMVDAVTVMHKDVRIKLEVP
jgi:hypothetical protein